MKRLVLLAGATLVMSSGAQAQDTEVKHNGEFRVRYYNDMTPSGVKNEPGNKSDVATRLKLGLTMRKGEDLQAHVTMLHQTQLGADNSGQTTLVNTTRYNTVNDNNGILVNQAYGWWKAGEGFTMKAGRFNVDIGGGEFFSSDNWKQVPHTHEGFHVGYDTGFAMFNGFLIQDKQLTASAPLDSDPEQHNLILTGDLKNMPEVIKTANITVVNIARSETAGTGSANAQHVGLTVGGEVAGFTYKAVYAQQFGIASKTAALETKAKGNMFDVTLGYGLPETMGLKFFANYHMDSGDDNLTDGDDGNYVALYYDSHRYGGMMDLFGWGNLSYYKVGAAVVPADDLEVGLQVIGFSKSKENAAIFANANSRQAAYAVANKSDLGMELDVYATKKYGPSFMIDAHFGAFMPGAAFKDATVKKEATILQVMLAGTMMF